jgi:hypothetical protein
MDSFAAIIFSKVDDVVAQPPTNVQNGNAQNTCWVVSQEVVDQTPVNYESDNNGQNCYCTIA